MPAHGTTTPLASLQGRKAASTRWGRVDVEDVSRDYAAAKLADVIERTVASAPPLTAEQRERLSALLRGGGGDAEAALRVRRAAVDVASFQGERR